MSEELPDVPLYYNLHELCKAVHCSSPRAEVLRSALVNAGYRCAGWGCREQRAWAGVVVSTVCVRQLVGMAVGDGWGFRGCTLLFLAVPEQQEHE